MCSALLACKQLSSSFGENAGLAASESGEPQIHALALLAAIDLMTGKAHPACERHAQERTPRGKAGKVPVRVQA